MHSILARQIKRHLPEGIVPPSLQPLLDAVNDAYIASDEDRALMERSMALSSQELTERYQQLREVHADLGRFADELEARVNERTAELRSANERLQIDIARREQVEAALRQAEEKYRSIFESASDGIFQSIADGRYLACNGALARIYGYGSAEELISEIRDIGSQIYVEPDSRDRFLSALQASDRVSGFEARVYRKDKSIIWISETARAVRDSAGKLLYLEGFVTDITARKQAEEALRESEERFALAVCGAKDGLWDWNLKTGQIYYSPRWKEMLGCADALVGSLPEEWFNRVHPEDLATLQSSIASHREGLTPHFEIEYRMMHSDGRYRWMLSRGSAIRDACGRATRMAGSQTDVSVRREAEEQLLRDALHDGLTGLPNRVLFTDRLERSLARISRDSEHRFVVLFLDLDRFKVINDSLGHGAGDQLLVAFAQRLASCVRPGDTIARLGGDEFTILLEDPGHPDDAVNVANRILQSLRQPFMLGTHEVFVSASIGIAGSETQYTRPQDVLRDADTAMYRAKAGGKSRHETFDAAMHARVVKVLQLENNLRRAIDRNEFELHYQPILKISTGKIRGFEALIRWRHPELGLISPADFIPVAEETGLITAIGKWVLFEACRQAMMWHEQFPDNPIDINVNLSGRQFSQPDLVEQVTEALHQTGLAARHLILEITESVVMEHPEATIKMLERLKALGVQINIDDFGTGYSSLAYLQRFPVDTMKIDRSFISRINENAENAEIVRTIISLAHNLDLKVTAEGIETAAQMAQLASLNCENAQGFYLSRPVRPDAATDLLRLGMPKASDAA